MDRITLMKTYAAVVEEGSFVSAARKLGMTPQLVSKYVMALENEVDVTLLNRSTRKVRLTDTGHGYYMRCKQLLEDFDELHASIRQDHSKPRGLLRVTAPVTFSEMYLIDLIDEFASDFPEIQIELYETDRFVDLLEENFDVAIRVGTLKDSGLIARRLADCETVLCASPDYLGKAGTPRSLKDLEEHECIIDTNFANPWKWQLARQGAATSVAISGRIRVNSASAAIRLGVLGAGIVFCPQIFARQELEDGRLVELLSGAQVDGGGVFAVFHSNRRPAAKLRAFVDFLNVRLSQRLC